MSYSIHRPDEAVMRRLLDENSKNVVGLLLRLAWLQGLTREEACNLTWDSVRLADGVLTLPDREVPLCAEMAEFLQQMIADAPSLSPYVLISRRRRERMSPESVSRLARQALEKAGMPEVRLKDLRHDFVLRQLEEHDWPYVLRISGLSVTTFQTCYADIAKSAAPREQPAQKPPAQKALPDEFKLWKIMQAEQSTAQGIALWMTRQMGLQAQEMIALTWDQVDFENWKVCLPERTVPMSATVRRLLLQEKERRAPECDPHILLSPNSHKPLDLARLSKLVRTALIRGGVENVTLQDLRLDESRSAEDELILSRAASHGPLSRGDVMALLNLSKTAAYTRLCRLVEQRKLVRVGSKYYLTGTVVEPERQTETILTYLNENGAAYCQDIAGLLHIGSRQCAGILKKLVDSGEILLRDRCYYLAAESAPHIRQS